jgi:hypothetical protein
MIRCLSLLSIHDHAERKENRDETKRIPYAHRGWIVLVGLCLLTTATARAQAPCWSTKPVSCMLKSHTPLLYPGGLQVFNLYWADNWDQRPEHSQFQITDIDNATKALLSSKYFDGLGQYGVQGLAWNGSTNSNRALIPCVRNPLAQDTIFSVFAFMACMEAAGPSSGEFPFRSRRRRVIACALRCLEGATPTMWPISALSRRMLRGTRFTTSFFPKGQV